jgi:hypothetical protein
MRAGMRLAMALAFVSAAVCAALMLHADDSVNAKLYCVDCLRRRGLVHVMALACRAAAGSLRLAATASLYWLA